MRKVIKVTDSVLGTDRIRYFDLYTGDVICQHVKVFAAIDWYYIIDTFIYDKENPKGTLMAVSEVEFNRFINQYEIINSI